MSMRAASMSMRWGSRSSRSSKVSLEVGFWHLCTSNMRIIADLVNRGNLLNQRQCLDLSIKLTATIRNIEELVQHGPGSPVLFHLPLENFYRSSENAKLLVQSCGMRDWWIAAVFQIQNENAFQEILLDVSLAYNEIYEQARSSNEDWSILPEDLRETGVFRHSTDNELYKLDQRDIKRRLKELANAPNKLLTVFNRLLRRKGSLKQYLAKYVLVKLKRANDQQTEGASFDTCSEILWSKGSEPSGTWGSSYFLGAGANEGGVCKTEWLGVPCAKKEFHGQGSEGLFLKEASILAQLNHPHVVKFICCGNGQEKGGRFIAMELMEGSLFSLIKDQSRYFPIHVVVDLIMQIARGMCYLHSRGIAHRDLKPQNVVVTKLAGDSSSMSDQFCVKLVDFGLSKPEVQVSLSNTISVRGVGTTIYRAPEVHPDANPNGVSGRAVWFKADIYSFAMTCAHLLSLETPSREVRPPALPLNCPEELVVLLRDCWNINPRARPSFREVCLRLETLKYKVSRGLPTACHPGRALEGGQAHFDVGLNFIQKKMEELFFYRKSLVNVSLDDGKGESSRSDARSQNVPCSSEHSYVLLPPESWFEANNCIICSICSIFLQKQ